ncbi:MAG: FAD-dependent oxidoreductase [Terracidiphilus sp.]|jgi:pyruvate/2-oxoglutarate dehydrogenase complex dihydrolipoamide dehydrogenase (E3) component
MTAWGKMERFDVVVLGSGEAGKFLAWTFGRQGKRVAVIERRYIGGSCPNIACLPSKNLIHSAKVASYFARGAEFGVVNDGYRIDMPAVRERKRKMVADLIDIHRRNFEASQVEFILGFGVFVAPRVLEIALPNGGKRTVTGDNVVISTGTTAALGDIPGLLDAKPLTHVEALELDTVPKHLIILGGGFVGLEFAQAMRRFGSEVTLIDRNHRLLHGEDEDVSAALLQLMKDDGIEVALGGHVAEVRGRSGESVHITWVLGAERKELIGSHLLVATGRIPNTAGIGLEQAGISLRDDGYIRVNERLETSVPGVWAVGECAGSPQFTHAAFDDFRIVRDNILGGDRTTTGRTIPRCLFTDPEFARVGLSERDAKAKGIPYRLAAMPMSNVLRTRTLSETRGFMKALIAADSDAILGFTAFGVGAGEIMGAVQLAMLGNLPFTAIRDAVLTHPTLLEGLIPLFSNVPAKGTV